MTQNNNSVQRQRRKPEISAESVENGDKISTSTPIHGFSFIHDSKSNIELFFWIVLMAAFIILLTLDLWTLTIQYIDKPTNTKVEMQIDSKVENPPLIVCIYSRVYIYDKSIAEITLDGNIYNFTEEESAIVEEYKEHMKKYTLDGGYMMKKDDALEKQYNNTIETVQKKYGSELNVYKNEWKKLGDNIDKYMRNETQWSVALLASFYKYLNLLRKVELEGDKESLLENSEIGMVPDIHIKTGKFDLLMLMDKFSEQMRMVTKLSCLIQDSDEHKSDVIVKFGKFTYESVSPRRICYKLHLEHASKIKIVASLYSKRYFFVNNLNLEPMEHNSVTLSDYMETILVTIKTTEMYITVPYSQGIKKCKENGQTLAECVNKCYNDWMRNACNCSSLLRSFDGKKTERKSACAVDSYRRCQTFYEESIKYQVKTKCNEECLPECTSRTNRMEHRLEGIHKLKLTEMDKKLGFHEKNDEFPSIVTIMFINIQYVVFTETASITLSNFISSFGGTLGVWFGASFLSIIHLLVYLLKKAPKPTARKEIMNETKKNEKELENDNNLAVSSVNDLF